MADEEVWLVTGSSRGLGRRIVDAAVEAGHIVVATARDTASLDGAVAAHGRRVRAVPLDVTDPSTVRSALESALEEFGRLNVVVNNAGQAHLSSVEDMPPEVFDAQIDVNFRGVVNVTRAVLPVLRRQQSGHIIQITSLADRIGTAGLSAYQSAKWAVAGFSEVVAEEVAPLGIRVTCVEPASIRTEMTGPSMRTYAYQDAYEPTVGAMRNGLRQQHGSEPCDPGRVAAVVVKVATLPDPPRRLLVGSDAVSWAGQAASALADSDLRWRELSESGDFDRESPTSQSG